MQLNRKAKPKYLNNFDTSQGSKPYCVKCKPCFSNKHSKADVYFILNEKGGVILKNKESRIQSRIAISIYIGRGFY